jgi:predicted ATPase
VAGAEAGPVLATVAQTDMRGLDTARHWCVAELPRSSIEDEVEKTLPHSVAEDSPDRGRASATAMTDLCLCTNG